ncbi:MAG: CBS domain-containing protein, partial [Calditrichales bacterium]|nr:CBS domain-containing protein [Calditrichales bacterium]
FFSNRISSGRNIDILQNKRITNLIITEAPVILDSTGFDEILNILMNSRYSSFPVIDKNKKVIGIIAMRDLRPILFDRDLAPLLLATDVMSENIFVLKPNDTMAEALRKMEIDDSELLSVVDSTETMIYQGVVTKENILRRYTKESLLLTKNRD